MAGAPVAKRLLWAVPTLFGVLVVVFALLRLAPGDPIAMMIGPGATPDDVRSLRALYGLDRSLPAQFGLYLEQAAHGEFGRSITLKQDVQSLIRAHLPLTLELSVLALAMALLLGGGAALAAAFWRGGAFERGLDALTGVVTAIPDFLWGLAGILFLGVLWPVLPVFGLLGGELRFESATGFVLTESLLRARLDVFASAIYHLAWPALSLALPLAAMIARVLKASLEDALAADYVLVAHAKGFGPWKVLWHEALRNALGPTLSLVGVQFTFLVGGTVLVEKLFGLPGLGNLAIGAVINRDLPLVQGIVALGLVVLAALFARSLAPHDPLEQDLLAASLPPAWAAEGDRTHLFGTDSLGRDIASRLVWGARPAMIVAVAGATLAALVGTLLGLWAGYRGGWVDTLASRLVDVWMSFPAVLLAIVLVAVIGTGLTSVVAAIAIIDWTRFFRVVRAETQAQARLDYVTAARTLGQTPAQILRHEVLPNVVPLLITLFTLEMGIAVVVEAILSFVGLSVSGDLPTWGGLVQEGRLYVNQTPWLLGLPVAAIALTVLACNALGDGLRAALDPLRHTAR